MEKNNTHKDYNKLGKFGKENWFKLVILSFLIMFSYQLNEIRNVTKNLGNGDWVTIDNFSNGAMNDLRKIRDGR
jgi:hypothetical protein